MNREFNIYEEYYKMYGFNNLVIDRLFKVAKAKLKTDIAIIVKKHELLSEYKLTGSFPKFMDYDMSDEKMQRNSQMYLDALNLAAKSIGAEGMKARDKFLHDYYNTSDFINSTMNEDHTYIEKDE